MTKCHVSSPQFRETPPNFLRLARNCGDVVEQKFGIKTLKCKRAKLLPEVRCAKTAEVRQPRGGERAERCGFLLTRV